MHARRLPRRGTTAPFWSSLARARTAAGPGARAAHGAVSRTTHFGFQEVAEEDKAQRVGEVFHRVASKYDAMNDLMSGTLHRLWKDHFVAKLGPSANDESLLFLDVAGGTGDIAFRISEALRDAAARTGTSAASSKVLVCDINDSMLAVGRERAEARGLDGAGYPKMEFVQGDAEHLPLEDNSVDAYTIAFGIRNVTRVQQALHDAYRVLRPGGRFMCLEFSQVEDPMLQLAYDQYSLNVIPALGEVVTGDRGSYQYLVESIRRFPNQRKFGAMMQKAGFRAVTYENLTFGVAAIHSGFKLQ